MKKKQQKQKRIFHRALSTANLVPIVGDAAIAGPVDDGRMIPLLILDSSEHPEIDAIINAHSHLSPGDVTSNWASIDGHPDRVMLILSFIRPVETEILISFSIEQQAILIEGILESSAVYLQAGRSGDRLIDDPDRPKVLVEIPKNDFNEKWDTVYMRQMTTFFRRKEFSKDEANMVARALLDELRKLTRFRMPQ